MWSCLIANHEALALATRFGMDVELLRTALLGSSAENYVLRNWGANTMAWADDDMDIVLAMAQEAGIDLPQAGLNRELCRTLKPKRLNADESGVSGLARACPFRATSPAGTHQPWPFPSLPTPDCSWPAESLA